MESLLSLIEPLKNSAKYLDLKTWSCQLLKKSIVSFQMLKLELKTGETMVLSITLRIKAHVDPVGLSPQMVFMNLPKKLRDLKEQFLTSLNRNLLTAHGDRTIKVAMEDGTSGLGTMFSEQVVFLSHLITLISEEIQVLAHRAYLKTLPFKGTLNLIAQMPLLLTLLIKDQLLLLLMPPLGVNTEEEL